MKVTSGFIGPQILNFDRSLRLSPGPKAVLFPLAKFLLEALSRLMCTQEDNTMGNIHPLPQSLTSTPTYYLRLRPNTLN